MNTKIEVNTCNNCPFMNYQFDDFSLGDYETYSCNLLQREWTADLIKTNKVSEANYFIKFYKNGNIKSKNKKTLDNCPLLEQNININYE